MTRPSDKQIMFGLIVMNAAMTLVMAAFFLLPHTWWQGTLWLIDIWGNGTVATCLARQYKDGAYG